MSDKDITTGELRDEVIEQLKTVYDPEIPVNIWELGLIYKVDVDADYNVEVDMTLTSPNCPVAESLPREVGNKIKQIDEVNKLKINVVWDPPWSQDMMSDVAKLELGM